MNTNNQNLGCAGFLIMLITFPIFFVSFCIARDEIKERFIYGDIIQSVVLEKGSYTLKNGQAILQNNVLYYKNNHIIKSLTIHISLTTDTIKSNEEYYQTAP